jgi:hypothetical protein
VTARVVLDGIKESLAGITPGKWKAYNRGIGYEIHGEYDQPINDGHRETFTKADATFIATAPADVARLTGAVDAVLEFHKPIESGHPQILGPVCEGCSDVDDLQFTFHPCETVEAIDAALEESQ